VGTVVGHAIDAGKFSSFWPDASLAGVLGFAAAAVTMMLGSIPQQDVFQRVASSKDERTAGRASILGGCLYFCFAFIPMFLAYSATLIDPDLVQKLIDGDKQSQLILPNMILKHAPVFAQVMFFGALLSAILSTASGALLAPTALFTENVIRPYAPRMGDKQFLLLLRVVLVAFTLAALLFALNSKNTMYEMVQNAYKVTLVSCIVPLAAGIYWRRANVPGALLSVVFGLGVWGIAEAVAADATVPPPLVGLAASLIGMVMGSFIPHEHAAAPAHGTHGGLPHHKP
jgi:Na+/proline symporter